MIPEEKMNECVARSWNGSWMTDEVYAAAPGLVKRLYEKKKWVDFVGKTEPPEGNDGRKMGLADIFTQMQDADWEYAIKNVHSYNFGMFIAMNRIKFQHKDVFGNPIDMDERDR